MGLHCGVFLFVGWIYLGIGYICMHGAKKALSRESEPRYTNGRFGKGDGEGNYTAQRWRNAYMYDQGSCFGKAWSVAVGMNLEIHKLRNIHHLLL